MHQALNLPLMEHGKQIVLKKYKHELRTPPELLTIFLGDRLPDGINAEIKWIDSSDIQDIPISNGRLTCVANHCPMNNYGKLNSFLTAVNRSLCIGDYYITCVEAKQNRQENGYKDRNRFVSKLMLFKEDIKNRVISDNNLFEKLYFRIGRGEGEVLSLSESLIKLRDNGFSIEDHVRIQDHIWIFGKKTANTDVKTIDKSVIDVAQFNINGNGNLKWMNSSNVQDLLSIPDSIGCVVNTLPMNDYGQINLFLTSLNKKLTTNDDILICFETKQERYQRKYGHINKYVRSVLLLYSFIIHRFIPRIISLNWIFFKITKGKNRVLSLSEALGRLKHSGFEIIDYKNNDTLTWVHGKKVNEPLEQKLNDKGILIGLPRIGYKGKMMTIYKIRTMHPYSSYLQSFLQNKFGTEDGFKIKNDFRITDWGIVFRKYWIDELPMLWNLIKGDLKLVGIRPLSPVKYYSYPEHLQKLRIKYRSGLIPPHYAYLPKCEEDLFKIEEDYIKSYEKNPIKTDIRYFLKVLTNILMKGVRSR